MRGYSITPSVELPLPAARPDLNAFQGESYTMLTIKHHRRVHREKLNSLSLSLSLSLSFSTSSSSHADSLIPLMTVRFLSGSQWWSSGCCRPFLALPGT